MLTLYYAPQACSLSPHVALRESGLPFELARVDFMRGKKLPDGKDFIAINPKGYVPAMRLEDGYLLTEGAVMVQYIADLAPDAKLLPPVGTPERLRAQEWLNFIATELHKGFGPFFVSSAGDEYRAATKDRLMKRLGHVDKWLADRQWMLGDQFSVVDGYMLYALRTWKNVAKGDFTGMPALAAYYERLNERPSVKEALAAEGLTR